MRKAVAIVLIIPALLLGACQHTPQSARTTEGAIVGAGFGAILGGIVTGRWSGAAAGALIGGASGAIIGSVSERPGYCYARDRYGNRRVVRCPAGYSG